MTQPVLYSFRRCPYAIRARLAIASARIEVELREVLLRDKAPEFLETSPTGTVPCLKVSDHVIDESFDIMLWALTQHDPENFLDRSDESRALIDTTDGPFKTALDRYKYHTRYDDCVRETEREKAKAHLDDLNARLSGQDWLFGDAPKLADLAILPFIRQFALTDKAWFDAQNWPHLQRWLETFLTSQRFTSIMTKYPKWQSGDPVTSFPKFPLF
ncbi:Glutathione S-transferase [Shimia gijangensis]|uniref:Glutathione S-transferase n=1 Tax=Shimia gijangensis TaxID=1470563 RepID=A0A1M6RNN5_9RHOB|nr:glutathione S-transferase [Shimia gijangensis]SHK34046.1 Glutathione S-transferase [Shimia gijangensis]